MSIQVLLTGGHCSFLDRCVRALSVDGFRVVPSEGANDCDVIVQLTESANTDSWPVARISIAPNTTGDAQLAADFTARELQLACHLAAGITAARRALEEAKQAERRLRQAVETDPLTGLANRRSWEAGRLHYVRQSKQTGEPLVMAILDLDNFKQVNTRHGYEAGDRVLAEVGRKLAPLVRRDDLVARFGGDEFGLLLPRLAADRAEEVVERIRSAVRRSEGEAIITASAGYAILPSQADDPTEAIVHALFTAADHALRRAKAAGGNCTVGGREV